MPEKILFFLLFIIMLNGCTSVEPPSWEDVDFYPTSRLSFALIPNDGAISDSVDENLARGVSFYVHPNAHYELSFDKDEYGRTPNLQLFRLYKNDKDTAYSISKVRNLEPTEKKGRFVYSFICEENKNAVWLTTLNDGREVYEGRTKNVRLKAWGDYSDHLSLNLVAVGKITDLDVDLDTLAQMLYEGFRKYYRGVTIDTVYVSYAHKHPEFGKNYPKNEPWIAGSSSKDELLSELGSWSEPGVKNALDIVLVHRFKKEGLLGLSSFFGANLGEGKGSTVVVANHDKAGTTEMSISAKSIVLTALHEAGHFFGLRHTTSTVMDQESANDFSVFDDGLSDTPYCFQDRHSSFARVKSSGPPVDFVYPHSVLLPQYRFALDIMDCPDVSNIMFPAYVNTDDVSFSKQQLNVIRENLMLMPH